MPSAGSPARPAPAGSCRRKFPLDPTGTDSFPVDSRLFAWRAEQVEDRSVFQRESRVRNIRRQMKDFAPAHDDLFALLASRCTQSEAHAPTEDATELLVLVRVQR